MPDFFFIFLRVKLNFCFYSRVTKREREIAQVNFLVKSVIPACCEREILFYLVLFLPSNLNIHCNQNCAFAFQDKNELEMMRLQLKGSEESRTLCKLLCL